MFIWHGDFDMDGSNLIFLPSKLSSLSKWFWMKIDMMDSGCLEWHSSVVNFGIFVFMHAAVNLWLVACLLFGLLLFFSAQRCSTYVNQFMTYLAYCR